MFYLRDVEFIKFMKFIRFIRLTGGVWFESKI